ncbi:hypothetical protein SAMN05192574_101366 [Mucilaginibacter gossypiicola]|uniref:DUF927 domain-containing protein n=1 Tax=Mucilaginibacter gossypiicola TaxID=551995 RepID=A0A1H8A5V3_9SPHI|nr:hypothetical protein [Mucilaginibacter gossypiicola]SEM65866.1 hypothetical protein SAMN05192574_101366 [Mucilaginibacter gossypiicola]
MLDKIQPILLTKPSIEPAAEETIAPYDLLNHDADSKHWHLVTNDELLSELNSDELPNLVSNLQTTTKEVCNVLRGIGTKIILVSRDPAEDLDLCDSLISQRFTISINTFASEYINYANWLIAHYTDYKTAEEISANLLTICEHISYYQNAFEREEIAKHIGSKFKIPKATVVKEINNFMCSRELQTVQHIDDGDNVLPAWLSNNPELSDFYWKQGWVQHLNAGPATGIYFATGNGPKKLTNFTLIPLVHIYTKDEMGNRRLTELHNGHIKTVLELPGKAFTSMEVFDTIITGEGAFFTLNGFTKAHLNQLKSYFLMEYPKCFELNTLGWQPEGFYSFSNIIYKDGLIDYNQYGFAQVGDYNYLSMSASNVLEGVRQEDDNYKNDKYLCYNRSAIGFEAWCNLMVKVYPEHGMTAIIFTVMTCFRDILFKRNGNFPLLYFYGPVGSGKSKIAESVAAFFTLNMPMFNLANGTDFAFFSLLSRFTNVAIGLNEFDENTINENWFTAIKGAYDGEGRHKGTGKRNKTTVQSINVAIMLIGQFLSTKDDNSVLSRTIPCKITEDSNRTAEKIALYDELKRHEKEGISSLICDVLQYREFIADHFTMRYLAASAALKAKLVKEGINAKNRIVENYSVALSVAGLISEKFNLGFTYDTFFNHCIKEISKLASVMSESNSLSQFWKTVEFLLDQGIIEAGNHFRVEAKPEVRLDAGKEAGKKISVTKKFDGPKKLLFLRLGTIHALYMKEMRSQTGKAGQNEQTIIAYMKDQESYLGNNPGSWFKDTNTSSYVFDYEMLGVNLDRSRDDAADTVTITGRLKFDSQLEHIIDKQKLTFTLMQDESYTNDAGDRVKNEVLTNCISDLVNMAHQLKRDREIKVTGILSVSHKGDRTFRRMNVTAIDFTEEINAIPTDQALVEAAFGKEDDK